ncbi:serine/threonine protein kinase [Cesiribacter andamanensis]|uniref:non-specific serine/threonine protein kinase n=1 Tax=Cesiribacter andamanensis AMV16 TaxID=1279009 RepID=M7N7Y1_9BACT|nr:serine/threonine-protein kinase [Cesiribacter andamanensis]EMR03311.1 Serine/threonine-protein kinase PrkC [Cesiribacter andamanensis AMV16]
MPVFEPNTIFAGRYRLEHLLGEGGFSEVWKASDLMAHEATVALKIYAPQQGLDEWGLQQFRNEFALTHNLSHPHLLKVNHFDVADGSPYLLMTYCPYGSLGEGLRKGETYSERQVALVMSQIGSALEEIHRQQPSIIHQDIKPDNILLLQPDLFMLADFGISSRLRTTLTHTAASLQAITVAYAPPERFDRHPAADAASDIFSLGVSLYEMCTGTVPWEGAGGQCLLKGARIPALPPAYSPALSAILEACMAADPSNRPSASAICKLGSQYLETGSWPGAGKKNRIRPLSKTLVSGLATAAVALVATAGVALYELEPAGASPTPGQEESLAGNPAGSAHDSRIQEPGKSVSLEPITPPIASSSPAKKGVQPPGRHQEPARQQASRSSAQPGSTRFAEKPLLVPKEMSGNTGTAAGGAPSAAAARPAATTPATGPAKKPDRIARSPQSSKSSTTATSRPATSNTTISKKKKPLFQLRPKSSSAPRKNPHHKRVKKLKRRFS